MSWGEAVRAFVQPKVITMLFLGFSAGLPLWLIFSSLSLWLSEAGIDRSVVTLFSWAGLGYSFKFVWAPLVDSLPLPWLTRIMGRRRSWILFAQILVTIAIVLMSRQEPSLGDHNLILLAMAAVMLGFSSATQDIVIDAYRIESAEVEYQALMSATYIAGYRIGMFLAGAGALYLASYFGSSAEEYSQSAWSKTYLIMAASMSIGIITTLLIPEPKNTTDRKHQSISDSFQIVMLFLCCVIGFVLTYYFSAQLVAQIKSGWSEQGSNKLLIGLVVEFVRLAAAAAVSYIIARGLTSLNIVSAKLVKGLYIEPIKEFFLRYGVSTSIIVLALVGVYRISDIVLGVIANVFYHDLGYTKIEIATVTKAFGLAMSLLGGFIGGLLSLRFGVLKILLLGAILSASTNCLFMVLAQTGYSMGWLYVVISADNISGGIASAAFVAFLSALTNIRFTAMQFAIFTSVMTLIPKVIGGYSGTIVNAVGYSQFFMITALLGIPVVFLILIISKDSRFR